MTNSRDLFDLCLTRTAGGASLFMVASEVDGLIEPPDFDAADSVPFQTQMEELERDLRRLEAGWKPTVAELARAPILDRWGAYYHEDETHWRVVGNFHSADGRHDFLGPVEGRQMATGPVLAIDDEFSWMRDRRAFYRLGRDG